MTLRLRISLGVGLILLLSLGLLGYLGGAVLYQSRLVEINTELGELTDMAAREVAFTWVGLSSQTLQLMASKSEVFDLRIYKGRGVDASKLIWGQLRMMPEFALDSLNQNYPFEKDKWLVMNRTLNFPDRTIQVGIPLGELYRTLAKYESRIIPLIVSISLLAFWLTWAFMGRSLRPLERLTRRVENLDNNDPVPSTHQQGEVGQLARALEGSINALRQTRQAELEFITIASHELRTPVTALRAELELALRDRARVNALPKEERKLLERMFLTVSHLERLSRNLLILGRVQGLPLKREDVALFALCGDVVDRMQPLAVKKGIDLEFSGGPLQVRGDSILLSRVLENLIYNAIRYTEEGYVRLSLHPKYLQLEDSGEGLPEEVIAGLLHNPKGDLGIGMRVVREVTLAHGWNLELENLEKGCRIRIVFDS
jgi:signal transduction histidine kinase